MLYVKAETKGNGPNEEFWYNEAWVLGGFSFERFIRLMQEGTILVDIRLGHHNDCRPHDYGTGFRVMPDKLDSCFSSRKQIM